jgi:hypothetical protein
MKWQVSFPAQKEGKRLVARFFRKTVKNKRNAAAGGVFEWVKITVAYFGRV